MEKFVHRIEQDIHKRRNKNIKKTNNKENNFSERKTLTLFRLLVLTKPFLSCKASGKWSCTLLILIREPRLLLPRVTFGIPFSNFPFTKKICLFIIAIIHAIESLEFTYPFPPSTEGAVVTGIPKHVYTKYETVLIWRMQYLWFKGMVGCVAL